MKNLVYFLVFMFILPVTFAAHADILIGVAGPMTGNEAVMGEQFRRGAEKAVADINARGGVLGQKLALFIADDACDPKQAVTVANDMVSRNVAFVAGHFCSGSSIPASDVYSEGNVIEISPASTNPIFTERGLNNLFRVCGRDDAQGATAVKYLANHFPGARIAIVNDKSSYGKGLADQFRLALNAAGTREVLNDAIKVGDRDFTALVSRLKSAKADFLYFGGYQTEGGLLVRQMRDQGLKTRLFGGDALVTSEFWSITGNSGDDTLVTFGPDPTLNPANADLVAWFRANHYEPEAYTLYAYATIQAWAQAAEKAGTIKSPEVSAVLHREHFDTVIGKLGFDKKGDVTSAGYVVYVWKNGKYIYAQ